VGGTSVKYQGFDCNRMEFRRSTGVEPDASSVRAWVPSFNTLKILSVKEGEDLPNVLTGEDVIRSVGRLSFKEVHGGSDEDNYAGHVEGLHVVSAEKPDAPRAEGFVDIVLTDDRAFWDRGFLDRWEFNLENDSGTDDSRTVYPDTKSLKGLVEYICSRLYKSPSVKNVPKAWETIVPVFQWGAFIRPKAALKRILARYPAEVVLNLDRSVSFWTLGKGELVDRKGQPLPKELIQYLQGQGDVDGIQFGNPPERFVVVGGPRYRTEDVEMEPVVMVKGRPISLGLGLFLLKYMGAPSTTTEFRRDIGALLENGFGHLQQLWVLEAALMAALEQASTDNVAKEIKKLVEIAARRVLKPAEKRSGYGVVWDEIDKNAFRLWRVRHADGAMSHLLPVSPQAETRGGTRLPPVAFAHVFKKRQGALVATTPLGTISDPLPRQENATTTPVDGSGGPVVVRIVQPQDVKNIQVDTQIRAERDLVRARQAVSYALERESYDMGGLRSLEANIRIIHDAPEPPVAPSGALFSEQVPVGPDDAPLLQFEGLGTLGFGRDTSFEEMRRNGSLNAYTVSAERHFMATVRARFNGSGFTAVGDASDALARARLGLAAVFAEARSGDDGETDPGAQAALAAELAAATTVEERSAILARQEQLEGNSFSAASIFLIREAARDGMSQIAPLLLLEEAGVSASEGSGGDVKARYTEALKRRNAESPYKAAARSLAESLVEVGKALKEGNSNPQTLVKKSLQFARQYLNLKKNHVEEQRFSPLPTVTFHTNEPLAPVPHRLVDRALGIIRFAQPVGHLDRGDTDTLDGRALLQRVVVYRYGVRIRGGEMANPLTADPAKLERHNAEGALSTGGPEASTFFRVFDRKIVSSTGSSEVFLQEKKIDAGTKLSSLNSGGTRIIYMQDLVELITLGGEGQIPGAFNVERGTNALALTRRAKEAAEAIAQVQPYRVSKRILFLRPLEVDCNGLISGIRMATRQAMRGFETQVFLGENRGPYLNANKTRTRAEAGDPDAEAQKIPRIDVSFE